MTVEQARLFAQNLLDAANQAEAEGRDTLLESDLSVFSGADDKAREMLQIAIERTF